MQLFQVAIQASHEPCQIFTTTMSFGKEFHSSAPHCIKEKPTCLSLLQIFALLVSANHPFFFHCKSLITVSSYAFCLLYRSVLYHPYSSFSQTVSFPRWCIYLSPFEFYAHTEVISHTFYLLAFLWNYLLNKIAFDWVSGVITI